MQNASDKTNKNGENTMRHKSAQMSLFDTYTNVAVSIDEDNGSFCENVKKSTHPNQQ